MVAVSVTQITGLIFVSGTINSERCSRQIIVTYVANLSDEEANMGSSSKTVLLPIQQVILWPHYVKF
jgi:hypothetical protein